MTNYIILENYEEAQNYNIQSFKDLVIYKSDELKLIYIKKISQINLYLRYLSNVGTPYFKAMVSYDPGIPEVYKSPSKASGLQSSIYTHLIKSYAEYKHYNAITTIFERRYKTKPFDQSKESMEFILTPLLNKVYPDQSLLGYDIYIENIERNFNYLMHNELLKSLSLEKFQDSVLKAKEKINNLTPLVSGICLPDIYMGIRYYSEK